MKCKTLGKLYQIRRTMVALKKKDREISTSLKKMIKQFGPAEYKNLLATIGTQSQRYISERKILKIGGKELLARLTSVRKVEQLFISNSR